MKSGSKLFFGFILILAMSGLAIYLYNKNPLSKSPNSNSSTTPQSSDFSVKDNSSSVNVDGSIVYSNISSEGTDIYSIVPKDKSKKKIFTDKDETLKILQTQSVTKDGKKILATLSQKNEDFGGSLWFITTAKGEKTKLMDSFASPTPPIISPDGKKIAYTIFSNAEKDYGFSLIVCDIDGLNKVKVDSDGFSISNTIFSSDGSYIAYIKSVDNSKVRSAIYRSKIDGSEKKEIYKTDDKEIIYSLDYVNNILALSKGPTGSNNLNKSEIYTILDDGKNLKQITNNTIHENFLNFSDDAKNISYLAITYEDNPKTATKAGEIHILNLDTNKDTGLGQESDKIIGWIP